MQNAAASCHAMQSIGRRSFSPAMGVHVATCPLHAVTSRLASVGSTAALSEVTQPGSYPPGLALSASPFPPLRYVCLPAPAAGSHPEPPAHAATNLRKRPTVTRYLSSRKSCTEAGSARPVAPPPSFMYVR